MLNIPSLELLVHELSRLPGVGQKTAQRLAYHILQADGYSQRLRHALDEVEKNVRLCATCFCYSEKETCHFCADQNRSQESLCVVEEPMDISRLESSGSFRGRYHVLQGSLSPLDGIGAKDLRIKELIERIDQSKDSDQPIEEVILALDADLEGDTTSLYLKRELEGKVRLTRIAHGVPFGSDIDYIDHRTLGLALDNRAEF
ncbi:recombination protein RecR [Candidatus Kaiserbacteria bacterium]|nr:MAG: recombination protein RecR [Candidatus Kaiserbacteria bacterium]